MQILSHKHTLVTDKRLFKVMIEELSSQGGFCFDLETEGYEWWSPSQKIVGVGLGYRNADNKIITWYIPINHVGFNKNLPIESIMVWFKPLFEDKSIFKIGANVKFDCHWLRRYSIFPNNLDDVQIMARLLRTMYQKVALDELIKKEFDLIHEEWHELIQWCRKIGKLKVNKNFIEVGAYGKAPAEMVGRYCGKDVFYTLMLFIKFANELRNDKELYKLYKNIERPLINTVIDMEEAGIRVDVKAMNEASEELSEQIPVIQQEIFDEVGTEFNIDSPLQLKKVLVKLGVQPEMRRRKKKDGSRIKTPSYDKVTLENNRAKYPIVAKILEYREKSKLNSTYFISMAKQAIKKKEGHWIYASIVQEAARTGRFSCRQPNLTNLPREEE